MNYLATIDRLNSIDTGYKRHVLVSGADKYLKDKAFEHYVSASSNNIVLIDFGTAMEIENLFPNPLRDVKTLMGKSNIRFLADCLGFDESKKGKLVKYIEIIKQLVDMEKEDSSCRGILLNELHQFSTNSKVSKKLDVLRDSGKISEEDFMDLTNHYCEVSDVGADFEYGFQMLEPLFADDSECTLEKLNDKTILYLPMGILSQDVKLQETILGLLLYALKMSPKLNNFFVIVNDVGQGARNAIYNFLITLPSQIEKACFTEDVFTMCGDNNIGDMLNKFEMQLFSRHNQMLSCEQLEKLGGEVKVTHQSLTVTHDYRISANSILDMLLQRDKTEAYINHAPVWEKRFRKEEIAELNTGSFLLWQNGDMSLCNL